MEVQITNDQEMCALLCDNQLPQQFKYCKRCGRELKSDQSKLLGYGPTCYKKSKKHTKGLLLKKK